MLLGMLVQTAPLSLHAAPCGSFTDVDPADPGIVPFCDSLDWIKNRSITLGCDTNLYCPNQGVTRLQMAAFMKRLGDALIHRLVIRSEAQANLSLTTNALICLSPPEAPAAYDRTAALSASVSAASNGAGPSTFSMKPVYSEDDGATLTFGVGQSARATSLNTTTQVNVANFSAASLLAGVTYRFGIIVQPAPGTTGLTAVACTLSADLRPKQIAN
jgi:hypothetical protein